MKITNLELNGIQYSVLLNIKNKKIKSIRMKINLNKKTLDNEITITGNHLTLDKAMIFIKCHEEWVIKRINENNKKKDLFSLNEIKNKEIFYLFGQAYQLELTDQECLNKKILNNTIYITNKNMIDDLKESYLTPIVDIFDKYQKVFKRQCELEFKNMISKYGYCLYKDNKIVLSKQLVHLPVNLIEYVIIHEFCHFIHPNHSRLFYNEISKHCANYRLQIKLLKEYSILCKDI